MAAKIATPFQQATGCGRPGARIVERHENAAGGEGRENGDSDDDARSSAASGMAEDHGGDDEAEEEHRRRIHQLTGCPLRGVGHRSTPPDRAYLTGTIRSNEPASPLVSSNTGSSEFGHSLTNILLVDHTWQNPNRIPAAQGPDVTVAAVRRRAV